MPSPVKGIFYTLLTVTFLAVGYLFSLRVQNWERGQPDRRKTTKKNAKRRIEAFRSGVWMRTLLRDGAAGLMHSLIYFPFLILFAVTNLVIFNELAPESLKFLHGTAYQALVVHRRRGRRRVPRSASAGRPSAATSSRCTGSASRAAPRTS